MFKVICELGKLEFDKIVGLKYNNCQPCEFSNYQMFGDTYDPELRAEKAANASRRLNDGALDISKPEYKGLANKLYYLKDLSSYRYISIFDESTTVENVIKVFDVTWIYSAIIRLHSPTAIEQLLTISQKAFTWFNPTSTKEIKKVEVEKFYTIWEKRYLFHIPEPELNDKLLGTIQKGILYDGSDRNFHEIDKYFLTYLLSDKQNSKCIPITANQITYALQDENNLVVTEQSNLYKAYKASLPKLFGLEFLEKLSILRACSKYGGSEIIVLKNEIEKFILKAKNYDCISTTLNLINICENLGGNLLTVFERMKTFQAFCKGALGNGSDIIDFDLYSAQNDLFSFDCYTIEESLTAVSIIEDIYMYLY